MKKLIEFPKEKSKNVWALKKAEGQRLFLSMSLFSLLLVAVFANEQMVRGERPFYFVENSHGPSRLEDLNRAIASAQPVNVFRDLEWEHQLAKRLGNDEKARQPASVSQKLTLMDDLRYGPLAGKYRIRSVSSVDEARVAEIEYVDSNEITDSPIHLADTAGFLAKYKSLMNVDYATATLAMSDETSQQWQLLDDNAQPVGRAQVELDSEGNLLRLSIEK